jgi:hypothetical protein
VISGLCYKIFTIVTYDCNDSSSYCKTTLLDKAKLILTNLASAKSVNYDRKVCYKLKHTLNLMSIIYDRKTFIVQATGPLLKGKAQYS